MQLDIWRDEISYLLPFGVLFATFSFVMALNFCPQRYPRCIDSTFKSTGRVTDPNI